MVAVVDGDGAGCEVGDWEGFNEAGEAFAEASEVGHHGWGEGELVVLAAFAGFVGLDKGAWFVEVGVAREGSGVGCGDFDVDVLAD